MIIIMTAAWAGVLLLLIKLGLFKQWAGWMSGSCVVVFIGMLLVFVIPMNFGAPSGPVVVLKRSVQISPNVAGPVVAVPASANTQLFENDVLFEIDPVPYQATVDSLSAKLALAELSLDKASKLAAKQAGSVAQGCPYHTLTTYSAHQAGHKCLRVVTQIPRSVISAIFFAFDGKATMIVV
jgi:multidrug resistance efflux pump